MGRYHHTVGGVTYQFTGIADLLAKATPERSGDQLAGCAATSAAQRVAAQYALADLPLATLLQEPVVPYENDEVTQLILDSHDPTAFEEISHHTVGSFRDWLLGVAAGLAEPTLPSRSESSSPEPGVSQAASPGPVLSEPGASGSKVSRAGVLGPVLSSKLINRTASETFARIRPGLTPEMVAAVSKLMRNQDLITVAQAVQVTSAFRTTIGSPGSLATRLQPNHPTDTPQGVAASMLDGLLLGCGDAVVGINPATDSPAQTALLLRLLDDIRTQYSIPMQSCVLSHVTTTIDLIHQGEPVDLVFQSIAGTEQANASFGVNLALLEEANQAGQSLKRGTVGQNVMYFETGQGSALSAGAHLGVDGYPVDQQTLEARAYGVARAFDPLLVNTVVGFIGPEYLYDGKQIIRAGLEDYMCGKLLGLPMGVDVCYTNHAEADQDDMDTLLTLLATAGVSFVVTVPGADDIMLGYQSLSFHDILYIRRALGLRPAPEFEQWLCSLHMMDSEGSILPTPVAHSYLRALPGVAS